jgi:hypothetical protein
MLDGLLGGVETGLGRDAFHDADGWEIWDAVQMAQKIRPALCTDFLGRLLTWKKAFSDSWLSVDHEENDEKDLHESDHLVSRPHMTHR